MADSLYKFDLIQEKTAQEEFPIKYSIKYQGRNVGTIETAQDGKMVVSLDNGKSWSGSLCGDMWDFLLSEEPFKDPSNK